HWPDARGLLRKRRGESRCGRDSSQFLGLELGRVCLASLSRCIWGVADRGKVLTLTAEISVSVCAGYRAQKRVLWVGLLGSQEKSGADSSKGGIPARDRPVQYRTYITNTRENLVSRVKNVVAKFAGSLCYT